MHLAEEEIQGARWEGEAASEAFEAGPTGWDDLAHEAPDDLWTFGEDA